MRNKLIIGLILVTIGVFLLLSNLGIVSGNVFYSLFDLWPLLLIVIGVNIIFRNNRIVPYITWILFFIILILYGLTRNTDVDSEGFLESVVIEKRAETQYANLDLEIGASDLTIDSTDGSLLRGNLSGRRLDYVEDYSRDFEIANLDFQSRSFNLGNLVDYNSTYDFYLNRDVIWDLDMDLGAINGEINLVDIPVRSLEIDLGAANLGLLLGDRHDLDLYIDSGASNLEIAIPQDVGLRIDLDAGITSTNIDDLNLIDYDDYYLSSNYDSANIKISLDIDTGVGKISFSYR